MQLQETNSSTKSRSRLFYLSAQMPINVEIPSPCTPTILPTSFSVCQTWSCMFTTPVYHLPFSQNMWHLEYKLPIYFLYMIYLYLRTCRVRMIICKYENIARSVCFDTDWTDCMGIEMILKWGGRGQADHWASLAVDRMLSQSGFSNDRFWKGPYYSDRSLKCSRTDVANQFGECNTRNTNVRTERSISLYTYLGVCIDTVGTLMLGKNSLFWHI